MCNNYSIATIHIGWFCLIALYIQVEKIKQDNRNKDCQIKKMEETVHSLDSKNKIKEQINKSLQEKVWNTNFHLS